MTAPPDAANQHLASRHAGVHWLSGPPRQGVPANADLDARSDLTGRAWQRVAPM